MPLFDCGYYMKQDYIKPFVEKPTDDDYNPITLLMDINDWWFELPRNIRPSTPRPGSASSFAAVSLAQNER